MKTARRLLEMKDRIEKLKTQKAQAEGAVKQLFKELKDDFDCEDTKEARGKLKELRAELEKLETKIEARMEKLEEEYDECDA